MFPWVYGFEWTPGHLIFVGVFFAVGSILLATVATAVVRSLRDFRTRRAAAIQWRSDFEDLPHPDRACRHDFTGEMPGRECELAFDCRECHTHAGLVERQELPAGAGILNRYYHRGHTWVRLLADGTGFIGLDDIGRRLTGVPDMVELPAPGTMLEANGTAWRVRRNGREFRLRAPVSGEVIETNGSGEDWVLKIRVTQPVDTRHLLRGGEVHAWYRREVDRLQLMASELAGAPALADGGQLVEDIAGELPAAEWEQICGRMFLDE